MSRPCLSGQARITGGVSLFGGCIGTQRTSPGLGGRRLPAQPIQLLPLLVSLALGQARDASIGLFDLLLESLDKGLG